MGTRHLTCVVMDGEYKVAQYGQCDGYPEGAGRIILKFLKNVDLEKFRTNIAQLCFVPDQQRAQVDKDIMEYQQNLSKTEWKELQEEDENRLWHPTQELNEKYLSRPFIHLKGELGYKILAFIMRGDTPPLLNDIGFAGDSLFCEWVYVIDLDENKFEVYRGFNKELVPEGERFYDFEGCDGYNPVKHLVTFELDQLPSEEDFLERCPDIEDC